jgi:hypothetical protein
LHNILLMKIQRQSQRKRCSNETEDERGYIQTLSLRSRLTLNRIQEVQGQEEISGWSCINRSICTAYGISVGLPAFGWRNGSMDIIRQHAESYSQDIRQKNAMHSKQSPILSHLLISSVLILYVLRF